MASMNLISIRNSLGQLVPRNGSSIADLREGDRAFTNCSPCGSSIVASSIGRCTHILHINAL